MLEYNDKRVVYCGNNDFALSLYHDRCLAILLRPVGDDISSINEAIEDFQVKLTVENSPELFREKTIDEPLVVARAHFSDACRYCSLELKAEGVAAVYDQVELQYSDAFWQFLEGCGAWSLIKASDFESLLMNHPECIGTILRHKNLVARFDGEIKMAIIANPRISAEIIVGRLAVEFSFRDALYLPKSLEDSEIDGVMISYIDDETANPNYLAALSRWPNGLVEAYRPSPEVQVGASRRYDELADKMFSNVAGFQYGVGVYIAMDQRSCKGIKREGHSLLYSFGGKWLEAFTDSASILNNLIYVFDFVDVDGLMKAPAHKHEESTLLSAIGLHVAGEYRISTGFRMRSGLTFLETSAYASFLEGKGTSLERALEWFYNEYVESEFGITGFSLALPVREASWLDKCKAVGPEIERALKSYSLFARNGEVDDAYFPFVDVKTFSGLTALDDKKYVVAGPEFEKWGYALLSDQCMLSYLHEDRVSEPCFFEMMMDHFVTRSSYVEWLQGTIGDLIEQGLVSEEDGRLSPTSQALYLKLVWERDALPLRQLEDEEKELIESMVGTGLLSYCNRLFAPSEASYLEYMFNNASFPNSLGIRNRYDHADSAVRNPWADEIKDDYYKLLSLLISITLKINEELMWKTGKGWGIDWIDWPYYDESVFVLAEELL